MMKWGEFCSLLAGLSADSPLGRIVQIRCENDPKMLKHFTQHQRKIRSEWRNKTALRTDLQSRDKALDFFKNMFIGMAGGEVNGDKSNDSRIGSV